MRRTGHQLRALAIALIAALAAAGAPARAAPVRTGHLTAELVTEAAGATPGGTIYLALDQKIAPGWHTYWRNPGDSGQPTTLAWTLPAGWRAGDIVWPTPAKLPIGPLMDYGYEGEVLLPTPISIPATARPGSVASIAVHAQFLVCKDVCVPEDAALSLNLPVVAGTPKRDPVWGQRIAATLAAAPKPSGLVAAVTAAPQVVKLSVTGAPLKGGDFPGAYFFPFDSTAIDHARPQAIERGPDGLTLSLAPGSAFSGGKSMAALSGVLLAGGHAYQVDARAGPALAGAAGLGAPAAKPRAAMGGGFSLPLAVVFAFLGGLILNLMPCVFPVLSLKAAALARHAHDPRAGRADGLAFGLGVVVSFLVLAGLLIAAKAAGQAVGWGFQLQSPAVVGVLALVMLLVGLNLSGVFEVGQSVQGAGGGLAAKGGLAGAFFTGALAVVVAAPCTAPFMAGALGYAVTQAWPATLAVFLALGLGLAAPFTALAFMPGLLRRLPRPGGWMDLVKQLLAFPMYAAAAWLAWVLVLQAGDLALARIAAAIVVAAFAAVLFGLAQRRMWTGGGGAVARIVATIALVGAVTIAVLIRPASTAASAGGAAPAATLASEAWSPARVAELQGEGKPVFVDFTAAWCVTCQVNERVALDTREVADAFRRSGVVYLKADWTNRNAEIAHALADHGRVGVPLYLMYGAGGGETVVLPQLLTAGAVAAAAEKAAAGRIRPAAAASR